MSNFDLEDLERIYEAMQPHLGILSEESVGNGVSFSVRTSPDGMIELSSTEYFETNGKYCQRVHTIRQSRKSIEESSKTEIIRQFTKRGNQ